MRMSIPISESGSVGIESAKQDGDIDRKTAMSLAGTAPRRIGWVSLGSTFPEIGNEVPSFKIRENSHVAEDVIVGSEVPKVATESCSPVCKGKERSSARERVMNVLWAPPSSKTRTRTDWPFFDVGERTETDAVCSITKRGDVAAAVVTFAMQGSGSSDAGVVPCETGHGSGSGFAAMNA